ncbi:MAG: leucine-rich repeat domain-containing protein [Deltaproteobacteria bacterium]|nr:leucine-rich repeat domain-containing protein [Deltaproteobacteria bacterium]
MGIANLGGVENLVDLVDLSLFENDIEDLTPLVEETRDGNVAALPKLTSLQLGANLISSVEPVSALTSLERLGLGSNQIGDVAPLSDLQDLRWLDLGNNQVTDVSALAGLTNLTWLDLDRNPVGDMHVLDGLDAEVYVVYQNDWRSASDPLVEGLFATATLPTWDAPEELTAEVDSDGVVSFHVLVGEERYPVLQEFAGQVMAEGDLYVLHRDGRSWPLGLLGDSPCSGEWARSCHAALGTKVADTPGLPPVYSLSLAVRDRVVLDDAKWGEADTDLLPYVLASPNQWDAGSCLFMAVTGTMELLMNQHLDPEAVDYKGDTDLSERFLMNASDYVPASKSRYFLTDILFTYEHFGGSLLDRDYPFVCDYVRDTSNGVVPSSAGQQGAYPSMYYNWFDDLPGGWQDDLTPTPEPARTLIFMDPRESQWSVALMDDDHVERIKYELRTKNAPVIVVYNHYLYWHADIIVGYDDTVETGGCPMVRSSVQYFNQQGATSYARQIEDHIDDLGGCRDHGIFYVRDSIYDGTSEEPTYQYGGSYHYSDKYSQRIIERTYDWVRHLGNHVYTVHRR